MKLGIIHGLDSRRTEDLRAYFLVLSLCRWIIKCI